MSKFSKVLLPLLTILTLNAAAPTAGEIATTEALLGFRVTRNIVWLDPLNQGPLHLRGSNNEEFVVAAKDDDVHANLDNAGTIMGGYLANANSIPAATSKPAALVALLADANWNRLFVLAEKYRKSLGNIMRDCFGREIYRLRLGAADTVGNTRDVIDIPSLVAVIQPVVVAGAAVLAPVVPELTAGERATAEALLTFRRGRNFVWLDPRTRQALCRLDGDNFIHAAKDDDVHANLDNAGTIMGGYLANAASVPAATTVPAALTSLFADANYNNLYTLVETARRAQNRFVFDCLGNPLYKLTMGNRAQSVDMREIIDIPTLLTAVEAYFPAGCRSIVAGVVVPVAVVPALPGPVVNEVKNQSVVEDVLGEVDEKKENKKK